MRIRTGITELPGVAVTASVLAVCDFPGDLVNLKIVAAPDILAEAFVEGIEPGGCGVHPSVDSRGWKIHALLRKHLDLPVFRDVVHELVRDNLCEHDPHRHGCRR